MKGLIMKRNKISTLMPKMAIMFLCILISTSFAGRKLRAVQQELADYKEITEKRFEQFMAINKNISDINDSLRQIRKNHEHLEIMLNDISPARLEEAEIQLAYLTEAFRDLFTDVKNIQLIPIIQKSQKTYPRPQGFAVSNASALLGSDEYNMYSRALDSYRKKFFDEARLIFNEITTKFPSGSYIDRAYFWTAESFFSEKNYTAALEFYERTLTYKGSSKEDDSQYKLAICYLLSDESEKAEEEFTKLVQKYPASDYVPKATEALRRLAEQKKQQSVR